MVFPPVSGSVFSLCNYIWNKLRMFSYYEQSVVPDVMCNDVGLADSEKAKYPSKTTKELQVLGWG